MLKRLVHALAECPFIFDVLRRALEFNYIGERKVIRAEVPSDCKILDLGCGTGELCGEFCQANYVGVDISEVYIQYAKRKHPSYKFEIMNATSLDFLDAVFDVVLISGVLHHCEADVAQAILGEAKRVLLPGGKVVVWEDVPTRGSINLIGKAVQKLDEGENILSPEGYSRLFEKFFGIEKTYPMRSGFCDYQVFILRK